MNSDMLMDVNTLILTVTLAVWTLALVLDIKTKASRLTILIDSLVIEAVPLCEYFYLDFPLIDVIIINGITFLLIFVFYYRRLVAKNMGKSLKEVEAEITEIESRGG